MSKYVVQSGWTDAPHLDAEAQKALIDSYQPHERDARTRGMPALGAGAIYPVPESDIVVDPFQLPPWYRFVYALDVGWNKTAALWGALDAETDVLYLYSEYYRGQAEPAVHAQAILSRGKWIPGVVDPGARGRAQKDGEALLSTYTDLGLTLVPADNSRESGIYAVWTRLSTGRIKVFKTLQNWLGEYRVYRRDEKGAVVKENDHLMDDTRYMVMSGIDLARDMPIEEAKGSPFLPPGLQQPKHQVDFNPYREGWDLPSQSSPNRRNWTPGQGWR